MEILFHQYDLVKERRETLFQYCESMEQKHLNENLENFGGRSIGYLLVHTANTYNFWLGHFPKIHDKPLVKSENYSSILKIRALYHERNDVVFDFLKKFDQSMDTPITNKLPSRNIDLAITPLQLFTHVVTHEYHHKGQILSMSRQLGYTPIDTDIIRFD